MKRKGFTLIELLAVIVVLAIIALIATPIVMNTIKKVKKGAVERSTENYMRAVELTMSTSEINRKSIPDGEYLIQTDGNICSVSGCGESDKDKIIVEVSGKEPTSGIIVIKDGQIMTSSKIVIGEYVAYYDDATKRYIAEELRKYNNGEVVYFNVTTGEKCSSSDYTKTQSNTGVKEGCMKFYAYNDSGGNILNLVLDHNTTATVTWHSSGSNANGPQKILDKLKEDTSLWKGTMIPTSYTVDQTGQTSNAKYTIDYSGYNARLITAQEVATITGNTSWNEKIASNYYYFDTNTNSASNTCTSGKTDGCKYGWLYDRTNASCTTMGCLNNSDQVTYGYWTATSRADHNDFAWSVYCLARVSSGNVDISSYYGVRPVIEVIRFRLDYIKQE